LEDDSWIDIDGEPHEEADVVGEVGKDIERKGGDMKVSCSNDHFLIFRSQEEKYFPTLLCRCWLPYPKRKKDSTPRKSAARLSIGDSDTPDKPGDLRYPGTFINIESNEQKVGAYIGFNDVAHARTLILSWPVMKAIKSFQPIAHNMSKKRAFKLIADAEGLFKDVEDPINRWPIRRYLACFLIRMEEDLRQMAVMQTRENQAKQDTWYREFCEIFPGAVIAKVGFSASHLEDNSTPLSSPSIPVVRAPIVGPYAQENRLEPINRCWNILKYFLNCFMLTHIFRYTSTIMASGISDPALAYFPCSNGVSREMWTAA
jgi:hypothetical protein